MNVRVPKQKIIFGKKIARVRKKIARETNKNKKTERLCENNTRGKREALYEEHCEPELADGAKPVSNLSDARALIPSKSKKNKERNSLTLYALFSCYTDKNGNKKLTF